MKREAFEAKLLELWLTTRIPLTRPHLQHLLGLPRKTIDARLVELSVDGVIALDRTAAGEEVWRVEGAARPQAGPDTVAMYEKLRELAPEAKALTVSRPARETALSAQGPEKKSIVISGLLSLVFGPFGWLYAGSLGEALTASGALILAAGILPSIVLTWLLGAIAPLSAIAGMVYAYRHNRHGQRMGLLSS